MSTGHSHKAECKQNKPESSGGCEADLCTDLQSLEDESLAEENTLSACLLRILQSGQCKESSDNQFNSGIDSDKAFDYSFRNHALEQGSLLSPTLEDLENRSHNFECCKRGLKGCNQRQPRLCPLRSGRSDICQKMSGSEASEENGSDKLKNWKAAGEALRKVLHKTSGKENEKVCKKNNGGKICLKIKEAHGDNKSQLCEEECLVQPKSPVSDDPMNVMLEEYHSNSTGESTRCVENTLEPHQSTETMQNSQKGESNPSVTKLTPGLASVRERIQQITAKINLNKPQQSTAGQIGGKKVHSQRYNRTTGPLQTRSSSIGHGSSSESEEAEVDTKRHRMYLPRCKKGHSSSRSPKSKNAPVSLGEEAVSQEMNGHATTGRCLKCESEEHDLMMMSKDAVETGGGSGEERATLLEILSDLDSQEDMVLHKLQRLTQRHDYPDSDDANSQGNYNKHHHSQYIYGSLVSGETDSVPNLADIESSLQSEDNETLGESDINDKRWPDSSAIHKCGCEGEEEPQVDRKLSHEADTTSGLPCWGSDCDGAWSEQSTLKRNKAKSKTQQEQAESRAGENDAGQQSDGDGAEELEEIEDLVFNESYPSDHDNGPVQIRSEELAALTDIISDSSNGSASDRDAEADDEFECDCAVCQQRKSKQGTEWVTDEEQETLGEQENERIEYYNHENDQQYVINMAELTPLDLLLMREGRRELLELMFQNVIMQMLAVYPDLLGDQAPPPAMPSIINGLPTAVVDVSLLGDDATCPICLCNFETGEEMRELPCHHSFHNLCIQAWLTKSGTCPVCRHVLSS